MPLMPVRVLIIEDDPEDVLLVRRAIARSARFAMDVKVETAPRLAEGIERIGRGDVDLVLLDLTLPDSRGPETLRRMFDRAPHLPLIVLTDSGDIALAVDAVQAGAQDYILKEQLGEDTLLRAIRYAMERHRLRRSYERSLRQSRDAQYRKIIEMNADGILIVDREGAVRFANPAALALFARPADALLGTAFDFSVSDGENREVEILRPNGTRVPVELRSVEIDWEDRVAHLVSLRDNTIHKRIEEHLLRAKLAAEEASRAKSEFLAAMSHELRTPLNSVLGFSRILRKNRGGRLDPQDLNCLERILSNGKHLLQLINDILDLSKVESGRMEMEPESVDLDGLVRETLAGFEGQVREKGLRLEAEIPAGLAPLRADGMRLRQALINLVGNAVKFTESGAVTVRVLADPAAHRPERLEVEDTGIGIAADRLDTVFDAFEQADRGTARKYGGSGLGLTITRRLLQGMGFRVEARSAEGRGTTFTVVFGTAARAPAPPDALRADDAVAGAGDGTEADVSRAAAQRAEVRRI